MKYHFPLEINKRLHPTIGDEFDSTRTDLLTALALAKGGRDILSELAKSDSYVVQGRNDVVMRLYRRPDGLFLGHAHGADGKIIGQARWLKVTDAGSRLLSSAGLLTGQLMLLEISQKLDRIQNSVDRIRAALDDDRAQELRGAIQSVKDALDAKSTVNRKNLLTSTIPLLNESLSKMLAALRREIIEIPTIPDLKLVQVIVDRDHEIRRALIRAENTLYVCLEGIFMLGQAYVTLGEPAIGYKSVVRLLEELKSVKLEDAEHKARVLRPSNANDRPEKVWHAAVQHLPEMIELAKHEMEQNSNATTEIEVTFTPDQLKN